MKKLLFTGMILMTFVAIAPHSNAQDIAFNRSGATAVNPYAEKKYKIVSEIDVNINAVRDFKKNFKTATDAKWVQNENGASVYFTNEGLKMRTSYNARGKKEYTLKYYDESCLPSGLRQRVRSNYYDHRIVIVTEVNRYNHTYYLVKMENEKEYLTLRINDGEMSVFEKIDKR